ncbi:MAG: DNA polymerase III subunit delta' [Clostridia bacterium]|nr:DNA polymerase III subunit delta' [Clostridia bacterium]
MNKSSWQLNWPLIGQDKVISFLEKSILADKVVQTYVFSGPKDLGKSSVASAFARNLWQKDLGDKEETFNLDSFSSDVYVLEKLLDKRQIGIDQVRDFNERLGLSSFFNSYKIGIIKDAQYLGQDAQNALLKTLEEPREKVIIILLTENHQSLLQTIISRSQVLYFYPTSYDIVYNYLLSNVEIERSLAKDLAAAASGRPLRALKWAEDNNLYQELILKVSQAFEFINSDLSARLNMIEEIFGKKPDNDLVWSYIEQWELLWRDALLLSLGLSDRLSYPNYLNKWRDKMKIEEGNGYHQRSVKALKSLQQAKTYLTGSINLKNILENLAFHF